ncbi:MAG: DUF58 domain-containing protein [Chloroflexaceae bacterium]|jgi:uncharacterized protein (DUF58 family)|nr:DUF58 domain-containing protein [Chloroflexaceae bacterium]
MSVRRLLRPLGLLLLSTICFLAAQGTGIPLFFHLCYLLLALLLLAGLWAWLNTHGLEVQRETLTHRAYVGEHARERLTVLNTWPVPKLWVEVRDESDMPLHTNGFVTSLGGNGKARWVARTPCVVRGKFTLGPTNIISGDPFGIFRFERPMGGHNDIVVYPRMVDLGNFSLPSAELAGGQEVRLRTFNVTPNVATIRDYAPGDSFNRIHWRSTARTGQLMVKEFELDPTADIYLVLDMHERAVVTAEASPTTRPTRSGEWWAAISGQHQISTSESTEEYMVMAAASLARHLLAQNKVVGMVAWGQHHELIPAERESRQLFKMLEALAVLRAYGTKSLAELLVAEGARFSRNTTLVVITSSLDERWTVALQQLTYRGVQAVVLFIDPQSFGGWRESTPILNRLTELRVPTYRMAQSQTLTDALREPIALPATTRR